METQTPKPEKDENKAKETNVSEILESTDDNVKPSPNDTSTEKKEVVVKSPKKTKTEKSIKEVKSLKDDIVAELPVENKTDSEGKEIVPKSPKKAKEKKTSKEVSSEKRSETGVETETDKVPVKSTKKTSSKKPVKEVKSLKEEPLKEESPKQEKESDEASAPEKQENKADEFMNFDELSCDQLLNIMEETVQIQDVIKIKQKIALIKVAFLKANKLVKEEKLKTFIAEGGMKEEFEDQPDELNGKFRLLFDIYKKNKAKYNANLEEVKSNNLILKKQVLDDLKELINSEETLKKTYDEFKKLQDQWKEIGVIPQNEINNLWQSYHFLVEMFFDKVKINNELRDLDLKKNLEIKIELCEKAEELLLETSITKSFKELQKYHDKWKEIGPTPRDSKDEIWDRFKAATDKINERRRDYYDNIHESQKENLESKSALCEKAEELAAVESKTVREWQEQTDKINELMEVWRSIGPAPKKFNDEIWTRFKAVLNGFFESKKEFFTVLKEQQLNNYNIKLDLCVQAEAIKDSNDWQKTTNDLIRLQKEWKTVGPVPKKYSEKVWRRFRAACDNFFNRKSDFYSHAHEREEENLKLKHDLIQKIKDFEFGDDKKENLKIFKDFQREWIGIGHVPIREKDKIQKEFRKVLDKIMNDLQIDEAEISAINYKARFENLKDSKDSRNMLFRERNYLANKISKIKDDIILWENNIGFFADSKNADLLKIEFEKKIQKAKNEVLIFEAKLKVLNATELE